MTQAEINKNAVAGVMALEDAKSLYEAIGEINDDFSGAPQGMENMDYSADDLLAVNPVDNDPMGTIPDLSGATAEMDEETQKFVVDKFAEMAANLPGDTIDMADITPIATVIKAENGIKQDVNSYLEKLMMGATQRLSTQNVSDAQPNGTAIDFGNDETTGVGADVNAFGGFDSITGMEEAPGGIEPAAEPSLDANVGDEASFDGIGDELGDESFSFGDEDPTAGAGEPMTEDDGFDSGAIDSALDGMSNDSTDDGMDDLGGADDDMGEGDGGEDDLGAGTDDEFAGADDELGMEDGSSDGSDEFGADDAGTDDGMSLDDLPEDDSGMSDDETDEQFEATMRDAKAKLESIRGKYVQDRAAAKIRSIVESFQAKKNNDEKRAKLESIVANYKRNEAMKERKDAAVKAKLESIVSDYARSVNPATNGTGKLAAQLESIKNEYVRGERAKQAQFESAVRAKREAERTLKARLESISGNYHAGLRREAKLNAKLESIKNEYMKSGEYKNLVESVAPKSGEQTLKSKLDAILSNVADK